MNGEKTYCRYCEKLLKGRSDKMYCDNDCRNAYFNEQSKSEHKDIRIIDLALKKNRRILRDLLGTRKTRSLTEKQLLQKGFNFRYHTHTFITRNDDSYCFCYDYGYLEREDRKYMIVKEIVKQED
ncbi:MAG TPA: hypothetical protein VK543_10785 [Puia sp.]|nr:hypothetical protein [Puia sp.]